MWFFCKQKDQNKTRNTESTPVFKQQVKVPGSKLCWNIKFNFVCNFFFYELLTRGCWNMYKINAFKNFSHFCVPQRFNLTLVTFYFNKSNNWTSLDGDCIGGTVCHSHSAQPFVSHSHKSWSSLNELIINWKKGSNIRGRGISFTQTFGCD